MGLGILEIGLLVLTTLVTCLIVKLTKQRWLLAFPGFFLIAAVVSPADIFSMLIIGLPNCLLFALVFKLFAGRRAAEPTTDPDGGFHRYDDEVARHGLSAEVAAPGGGAAIKLLDAEKLAAEVLNACRLGKIELTRPWKAALLAGLIEWFPAWGRRLLARFTARSATPED